MIVTGAVSGPLISTCKGTPSSARTVSSRPRSEPNRSPPLDVRARSRLIAIRSAATTAPAVAALAPTTRPAAPVIRRQLAIGPPADFRARVYRRHSASLTSPLRPRHARNAALCYSQVASQQPPAEPGGDLVADGAQCLGPVLRGRLAVVTRAEQQNLVPLLSGLGAEVHDELVHRNRAGDEPPPAPRVYLDEAGRVPWHAFRVAQRDQAQRALAAREVPVAVGHARARRHLLDLHQPGPYGHRRPQ